MFGGAPGISRHFIQEREFRGDRAPARPVGRFLDYIGYWDSIPYDKRGTGLLYTLI